MAKVIVSDGFQFDPSQFQDYLDNLPNGDVVKHDDDLWRVNFGSNGEVFVRGADFQYDGDDQLIAGGISSFSFNAEGITDEAGPALVRIRDLDFISAAQVHAAIESNNSDDYFAILRQAFKHDDVLKGADQNDTLYGFKNDDKLKGNDGSDTLVGGKGKDALYGGDDDDSDSFVFSNGDSGKDKAHADRIHDFTSGVDFVNLARTGADASEVHIYADHGDSKIVIDAHDGHHKMVILVVGNDHVTTSDITLIMF